MRRRCIALGVLLFCRVFLRAQAQSTDGASNLFVFPTIQDFLVQARTSMVSAARVRGVVTYSFRQSSFYLEDQTAALFVASPTNVVLA
ncbi:MAG TPA: hypothetical protein VK633_03020, partial [Verrucomicrobiae bacterium]|nr:hypothetical protein [Verrucomicrobiae bacterium]